MHIELYIAMPHMYIDYVATLCMCIDYIGSKPQGGQSICPNADGPDLMEITVLGTRYKTNHNHMSTVFIYIIIYKIYFNKPRFISIIICQNYIFTISILKGKIISKYIVRSGRNVEQRPIGREENILFQKKIGLEIPDRNSRH